MMPLAMKKMLPLTFQRKYVFIVFSIKKLYIFLLVITLWRIELNCHLLLNADRLKMFHRLSLLTVTKNVFLRIYNMHFT